MLLIVDEESWPLRQEISTLAAQVSLAHDVLVGPRVIGRERWARMCRHRFTLYENVQADGIELISGWRLTRPFTLEVKDSPGGR